MTKLLTHPLFAIALAAFPLALPAHAQDAAAVDMTQDAGDAGAYLAARIAGAEHDFANAAKWFTRALIKDPSNPALMEGALLANIGLGQFEQALPLAKGIVDARAKSQTAYIALLADQAKRGEFGEILVSQAAGRSIGKLLDELVAAWAEAGNGRMNEALNGFDAIAATPGLEVFGLYHKALALASVGDFEGAEKIMSGEATGQFQLLRRGVVAHAQILSQLERNHDAITVLDTAFGQGQDPGIDALRAKLAAGEVVPYDVASNAMQGIAEVFFTMATALNGEADNSYTLIYSRVAAELRPDHIEAILLSAGLLDAQQQFDLAVETYASVPAADPTFYIAEIGRSEALYSADKKEAAIEVLQALSRSHPGVISAQTALGDALRKSEKYEDASKAYDAAIALITSPTQKEWALFYSRGICHERQKRWPQAEADFRRALELSPDQPAVLNYLGYSFLEKNQNLDEALSMIERAVAAQPDSGYILDSLAWGYYRLGRYADALAPMEKASLMEPVDPIVTDHLGDIYWSVGRRLEAAFQWRRALSFDPEEKDADRMRRKLEVGLDAVLAEEGEPPLKPVETAKDGN